MDTNRSRQTTVASLVVLVGLVALGTPALAEDCNATVNAEQLSVEEGENRTLHQFKVEVEVREGCAVVWFDLITEETSNSGETLTRHTSKRMKLHDGSASMRVNFELPAGNRLSKWRVEQSSCQVCDDDV